MKRLIWSYPPILLFVWACIHLMGDLEYYENSGKHLGYEGWVFLNKDLGTLAISFLKEHYILFPTIILSLLSICISTYFWIRKNVLSQEIPKDWSWKKAGYLLAILLLCGIAIRGGFQKTMLRPSHSHLSNDTHFNNLVLNGIFTFFYEFNGGAIPKSQKLPLLKSISLVQNTLESLNIEFTNKAYPVLQKFKTPTRAVQKPNIVIILLESWSAKFTAPNSHQFVDGVEVAPYFNSLRKKSLSFNRGFATGGRTTNGLLATIVSSPDLPGTSIIHKASFSTGSIAVLLKKLGYKTHFITGSDLEFENMGTHVRNWGFDEIADKTSLERSGKYKSGIWGIDDQDSFNYLKEKLMTPTNVPNLFVYISISTHYPYKVPDPKWEVFTPKTKDFEYLNTYHYADASLGEFFQNVEGTEIGKNTLFIVLADHTHHRDLDFYEDRHIPILFHWEKKIPPQESNKIVSQLDILPSILDLIGYEKEFSSFGSSVFETKERGKYFSFGNLYGWIQDPYFYFQDSTSDAKGFLLPFPNTKFPSVDCKNENPICLPFLEYSKAYRNLSTELYSKNFLFPLQ